MSLGTDAKSVHTADVKAKDRLNKRRQRFDLQAAARFLLPGERVAQCMHRCGSGGVAVKLSQKSGLASYDGVVTCGSVWHCPVCSAKISNGRRSELNTLLAWARREDLQINMITLTARHGKDDTLGDLLRAMKGAKRRLHNSRAWHGLDGAIRGHVTATEVTHGASGWHVHFHMIVISDGLSSTDLNLDEVWLKALEKEGLDGNGHAYGVQNAQEAGDYVTKWGAAEEVTLQGQKRAKSNGGVTPFQLLAVASLAGGGTQVNRARELFVEYATEFKGKRQLVWSVGLKTLVEIVEKSDQELAEGDEVDEVYTEVAIVPAKLWRQVVRRRLQAELLEVAEQGGGDFVEFWLLALAKQEELKHGVQEN